MTDLRSADKVAFKTIKTNIDAEFPAEQSETLHIREHLLTLVGGLRGYGVISGQHVGQLSNLGKMFLEAERYKVLVDAMHTKLGNNADLWLDEDVDRFEKFSARHVIVMKQINSVLAALGAQIERARAAAAKKRAEKAKRKEGEPSAPLMSAGTSKSPVAHSSAWDKIRNEAGKSH